MEAVNILVSETLKGSIESHPECSFVSIFIFGTTLKQYHIYY